MGEMPENNHSRGTCFFIIFPVIALTAIGLLTIMSAGANRPDPYVFVRKQALWTCIAFAVGLFASFINLKLIKKLSIPLAVATVLLLLLVLIPQIGREVNGSRRWIEIGSIAVQPSDLAKFSLIILLSAYLHENQRRLASFSRGLLMPLFIIGMFCIPIILEPDYGTTALCASIGFILIFLAGVKLRYILFPVLLGAAGFCIMVYHNPVRLQRIMSFLDVEGTKADGSYQLNQALLAFGSGGIKGVGIARGRQQLSFLPEAHTDFIFAIAGEELGMFCTMGIVALFAIIFISAILNLRKAPNLFEFSLCAGAAMMIIMQALFNMCVVTGLLPTKGISLPFISYGGSNLVAMFAFTGLLINCARTWNRPTIIKAGKL